MRLLNRRYTKYLIGVFVMRLYCEEIIYVCDSVELSFV